MVLKIEIEGLPPTVNQMYRTARSGTRYKRPEVQDWQDRVSKTLKREWASKETYRGDVAVDIAFTVKSRRRWDIDNRLKSLIDCLELSGIIKDDSQIVSICAVKVVGDKDSTTIALKTL